MLESNLKSSLSEGLSYKNEVKSIMSVQQGPNYGFLIEIQSALGTYYVPVKGFKSKDVALQTLRKQLGNK